MAPTKESNASRGTIKGQSWQKVVTFTIRARPLPSSILNFILDNLTILKILQHHRNEEDQEYDKYDDFIRKPTVTAEQFWDSFAQKCKDSGSEWEDIPDKIWAFGPQKAGGCLLIDARQAGTYSLQAVLC